MTTTREHRARAINALAYLMTTIRTEQNLPPWDPPGCVAALRKLDDMPLIAVAHTAIRYATDPANETPAHVADYGNRAWESFDPWPCKTHPENRSRRTNGECGSCFADRRASTTPGVIGDRGGVPMPAGLRGNVTARLATTRNAEEAS